MILLIHLIFCSGLHVWSSAGLIPSPRFRRGKSKFHIIIIKIQWLCFINTLTLLLLHPQPTSNLTPFLSSGEMRSHIANQSRKHQCRWIAPCSHRRGGRSQRKGTQKGSCREYHWRSGDWTGFGRGRDALGWQEEIRLVSNVQCAITNGGCCYCYFYMEARRRIHYGRLLNFKTYHNYFYLVIIMMH